MLPPESGIADAAELMLSFAARTGLGSGRTPRRYLWTDAFAVCNFLGLSSATGEPRYLDLALRLVDQVHGVLGQHRGDDGRRGWLSGQGDEEGRAHPTLGGLRIGKELPERRPDEPVDQRREWDRDGQYFHYLTRWMHALDQVARATGDARFNLWARELAATAHGAFVRGAREGKARAMYWKMSVDLSRPLVSSMGQHDPLDGLVTYAQLEASAGELGHPLQGPRLDAAVADFTAMVGGQDLATSDPLGIGGLLIDASRVAQLMSHGVFADGDLLALVLDAALRGLAEYSQSGETLAPASRRLAFRELGLAIGFNAARIAAAASRGRVPGSTRALLDEVLRYGTLGTAIRDFWHTPEPRSTGAWRAHEDINDVMLATCLAPSAYLVRSAVAAPRSR